MHSPCLALAGALLLAATSGCVFYSDDDDECLYGGAGDAEGEGAAAYDPGQRNPETGLCEYFGGGGGGGCGDPCNPCPDVPTEPDRVPVPTWGYCESQCTGLDEASCTTTSGCRTIYTSNCIDDDCIDEPLYVDCWSTDMQGPIQGGGCEGLDSLNCSMHDDCAAVHYPACGGTGDAEAPEPCGAAGFGYCADEGNPTDPGNCYGPVTCDQAPPACPEGTTPGIKEGCYTGFCIPLEQCEQPAACNTISNEASCIARADCSPIYRGEDCSCEDTVCTCQTWIWESCQ
jgi:hypothetical protein